MDTPAPTDEPRSPRPRRGEDSLFRVFRKQWVAFASVLLFGSSVGGALATRLIAPAQIVELRARVDTVRTDVREIQRDLDTHVRGMVANRDTVLAVLNTIREQNKLTVIGLCFAGRLDRSLRQQLHCDR